jgi:glutamine amidotransferase
MISIALIDYGRGNLRSVEKALEKVGGLPRRVSTAEGLAGAHAVVLPGVGAFGDAMANLEERKLVEPLREWLKAGRPFLGICLGYQLLFEGSQENPGVRGLGYLPGEVIRFPSTVGKVPHMGWNQVSASENGKILLKGTGDKSWFYHVHSFYPCDVDPSVMACETTYGGITFASGISSGSVHAFQFHPEKSQDNGLKLLKGFVGFVENLS